MKTTSQKKLAAIMFTDIAGYTALMGNNESRAMGLLKVNRSLQKPLIENHGGKWLKEMGDGVMASFDSAYMAVKSALEIQKSADEELQSRIRIGIHLGDITFEGEDIFGDGVNIASRLESIANPGGVYFSESVMKAIQSTGDFITAFVGSLHLKNVEAPVKTYCLQHKGMPAPVSTKIKQHLAGSKMESIAILPFDNLSGNPDQQYFVDGMHDALISEISKISSLRVISRTSTLRYRNTEKGIPQIAEELNVDGLIEASVLRVDDQVRIQVQLIQAFPEEKHLWADSYDKEIANIFDLHSAVVGDVTDKIKVQLTSKEKAQLSESKTVDPESYKAFLAGKHEFEKLSEEGFRKALEYFEKSIELDDSFAPAFAELANYYMFMIQMRVISVPEAFPKIYNNNRKALEIDPDLDEANYSMALMSWFEWDWEACDKGFRKVLQSNPNHVLANGFYAHLLMLTDRMDQAIPYIEKAVDLDPLNDLALSLYGVVLTHNGQLDEAIEIAKKSMAINSQNILTMRLMEFASYPNGDIETSVQMLDIVYSNVFPIDLDIKKEYAENGYQVMLGKIALKLEENPRGQDLYIGLLYNRIGKFEKAIKWLEKAYENHDADIPYFFLIRESSNLKSDPRIIAMAEKVKLPLWHKDQIAVN